MPRPLRALAWPALLALACGPGEATPPGHPPAPRAAAPSDAGYPGYILAAPEFRPVRSNPALGSGRWDTWLYMPWRYRWTIGTGEEGGSLCRRLGINGGVSDHGQGPLDWLTRWNLRFYNDHTAGKGALYLSPDGLDKALRDPRAVRPRPLGPALLAELGETLARNIRGLRGSPLRVAYALDDEISAGSLNRPAVWRLNDDDAAYGRWLRAYYGPGGPGGPGGPQPPAPRWIGFDEVRGDLAKPLREIDLSPFLDRMTYNDSQWANFLGDLVERCNREDPETPCGFVGGQAPSLWGGFDWAKLSHKIQLVEAYDAGSAPAILRSLAPGIPRVTTHFHDEKAEKDEKQGQDSWLAWHSIAQGDRGMIGWVDDGWFAGGRPRPWLERFAPTLRELGGVQGKKMVGARWLIQVSWCLDAEPHGATWPRRNDDHRLGTSHLVRKAWEEMLTDAGLRYGFLPYDEVVRHGVPPEYKVLILPACYALSTIEAQRIAEFAAAGGTVIADFACGLFDPHGRGRRRGALDGLFGVSHDGTETRADFFAGRLWVETDQEAGYGYHRYRELFATAQPRLQQGFAVAERRLPVGGGSGGIGGKGRAVYLNLSPQRYLMAREEGTATAADREVFLKPVFAALGGPRASWITVRPLTPPGEPIEPAEPVKPIPRLATTAWAKDGRTLVFVLQDVSIRGSATGNRGAEGLVERRIPIEVRFAAPVAGAVDERTGRKLPDGSRFTFDLDTTQAVFLSFAGAPPGGAATHVQGETPP
jgi:hypothetical protein